MKRETLQPRDLIAALAASMLDKTVLRPRVLVKRAQAGRSHLKDRARARTR